MAVPTLLVETAGGDVAAVPGSWTTITSEVLGTVTVNRGRQSVLDEPQAGAGDLDLNNSTRRWDPSNTSGPFNPLKLWRKFRLSAVLSGVTYGLMYGYATRYKVDWDVKAGQFSRTSVELTDSIAYFSQVEFTGTFAQQEYGARINSILGLSVFGSPAAGGGWPTAWRAGTSSTGFDCAAKTYSRAPAWDAFKEAVRTAGVDVGALTVDGDNVLTVNPGAASGLTFGENYLPYSATSLILADDRVFNDIHVTREGGAEQIFGGGFSSYGKKTHSRSTIGVSDADSLSLATAIFNAWAEPVLRPEGMKVRPGTNSSAWTAVLTLDIGDTFTLKRTPPGGGSTFSKTMKILGLRHSFSPAMTDWETDYYVVEV